MQIVSVKTEGFKGIKLVEIAPKDGATVIGGNNRAGKSSLLDSIAATIGGGKLCPKQPIRDGKQKATCSVQLSGDEDLALPQCTVTRNWTRQDSGAVRSTLTITTDNGMRVTSPQTLLDKVVGQLGFDPERFLRMTPKEQAEVLRELVGLDFTQLDADRQQAYEQRTQINRHGKELRARFDAMPFHEDAPDCEVSVSELMEELRERQKTNRANASARESVEELKHGLKVFDKQIESAELDVAEFEKRLRQSKERLASLKMDKATLTGDINAKSVELNSLKDEDEQEIEQRIAESETVNRKVRENAARAEVEKELELARKESELRTRQIAAVEDKKQELRSTAEWPVEGLGYNESGVTLFDRPFEQASSAEQREAAFAIVAGMNPKLKFAMIKDGSLLDEEGLDDFARIAAERGFQLFIERVGHGDECTIVIDGGEVREEPAA